MVTKVARKKEIAKKYTYSLHTKTGNVHTSTYKCKGMVELLEFIREELEVFDVDYWKIEKVEHIYG